MGDGTFTLGGRTLVARDGVVRTADGTLAGSALTMIAAVRHVHALGVPLDEALDGRVGDAGRDRRPRRISGGSSPGARADVVVLVGRARRRPRPARRRG